MIRRIADVIATMMARVVSVGHRSLNNRRGVLGRAEAGARGVARAQEQRGDRH